MQHRLTKKDYKILSKWRITRTFALKDRIHVFLVGKSNTSHCSFTRLITILNLDFVRRLQRKTFPLLITYINQESRLNLWARQQRNSLSFYQIIRLLEYWVDPHPFFDACDNFNALNPNWHELWKQEKCSALAPPRGIFFIRLNELGRVSNHPDWSQFSPPKMFGNFW